jgi:Domain of unknown function (DUF4184)
MPFTVSHAAAALPLRRLNLVWSAFVVGSMAPDFPYVVGTTDYRALGHQFPGVIEFTLPAAIFALWVFHVAIKRPAVKLLPIGIQQRLHDHLGDFQFGGPGRFVAILFSLVLGITTHLVWDAFTHPFTWPWRRWILLQTEVKVPLVGPMPTYRTLQYASTAIGLAALAIWVLLWYRNTEPALSVRGASPKSGSKLAITMVAIGAVAGLIRAWLVIGLPKNMETADIFLLVFGVTSIALVFWQVLIYCLMILSHQTWTIS